MRKFNSGATRDTDKNKLDYEGFLSPKVMEGFATYMHKHRVQADGGLRDSDNWQKGIPIEAYRKSLIRHVFQAWGVWRGNTVKDDKGNKVELLDSLYGILFNVLGYIYELTKKGK